MSFYRYDLQKTGCVLPPPLRTGVSFREYQTSKPLKH